MKASMKKALLLTGSAVILCHSGSALAAGTTAGTSVNNTASVTYSAGGTTQTVQSNQATFVVDRKVNLSVTEVGGSVTQTSQGAADQVTTFLVTNLTNAVQDFRLEADQQTFSIPLLGVDNFNVTNMRVFVDSNGNGTYDAGVDTATFIDQLAPDTSATVFIVANVPTAVGEDVAIVSLVATAAVAGASGGSLGADLVATSLLTADSPNTVDIVFADALGTYDAARDGAARAFDAYKISTAAVAMAKSAKVISDPLNLLVNPKAIPGAVVEYCLASTNAGPGTATNVNIADAIPAGTTYISNSLTVGGLGIGGQCVLSGTIEDDDTSGADETDLYGGSFDGASITASIPTLTTLLPLNVAFRVTIN